MAQNYQSAPTSVMVALLLFAAATPTAFGLEGLLGNPETHVGGQVCCSPTGNCNGTTAGIAGVPVSVNCTTKLGGASLIVGNGVTDVNGVFNISIHNILTTLGLTATSLLNGELPCVALIKLPLNQTVCPLLKTNGFLTGVLVLANAVITPVIGKVASLLCIALNLGRLTLII